MAGRKRKPTHLHVVQGTAQPCRINKAEPKAPDEPPRSAVELEPRAEFWYGVIVGRLQGIGIASTVDSDNVMLLAMRLAEVEERTADIRAQGATYVKVDLIEVPGEDGKPVVKAQKTIKANPAVAQRSEAMRHAQSLLAEFGLSPASRPKVSAPGRKPQANSWESLVNG